jgi:hypothetical protein
MMEDIKRKRGQKDKQWSTKQQLIFKTKDLDT